MGIVLMLLAAVIFTRTHVLTPVQVRSDSMPPTLRDHDEVKVGLGIDRAGIARDDLVLFPSPAGGDLVLKRVVGIGGDTVSIQDGQLYVGDKRVDEPYVDHDRIDGTYYGPVTVAAGQLLVLGDNRAESIDSRDYGTVPVDLVRGRVLARFWPPR